MERLNKVTIALHRGRYRVDWRDSNGKRHRPSFDTMADAVTRRETVLARLNVADVPPAFAPVQITPMSIKASINQHRKVAKVSQMTQTRINERYMFEEIWDFLLNTIKIEFVHEIKRIHLELFRAQQNARGLKASTINRKENAYRAWLNKCVSWGSIAKNPMDELERLSEDPPDIKTWREEQISDALRRTPEWLKRVLFFLDRTGRRPIDAARATFGSVDVVKKTIRVLSYKGKKVREIYLPITDDLMEMILKIRQEQKRKFRGRDEDFIFLNQKSRPVTTNAVGLALRKLGIRDVTAYGLRHSFIDGLVDDNVHMRDVQLLAGHAKSETTMRYTHRKTDHLRTHSENRALKRSVKLSV